MSMYRGSKMGSSSDIEKDDENYIITIEEAKKRSIKSRVTVLGIVTFITNKLFIQDNGAAICLSKAEVKIQLNIGDFIYVSGYMAKDHGLLCIVKYTAKIVVHSNKLPLPKIITLEEIQDCNTNVYQSLLVKVQDVQIRIKKSGKRAYLYDNLGNKLILDNPPNRHNLLSGDNVDVVGVLFYDENFQLFLRGEEDIVKSKDMQIKSLKPMDMSSTFDRKPLINAVFLCGDEKFRSANSVMYVDGEKVVSVKNESKIEYVPKSRLKYGEHKVSVDAIDAYGKVKNALWYFIVQEKDIKYNFYYGVPHTHTSYSDGMGIPYDAFKHARRLGLDYLIISDHEGKLKERDSSGITLWNSTLKQVEQMNKKYDDFLAIAAYEKNSKYWGHINIINSDGCEHIKLRSINELKEFLFRMKNISAVINHPDSHFKINDYAPGVERIINLIEVGNGSHPNKYMRKEKYFFRALDNRWYLGAINGQDNHIDNWGDSDNLTVVMAEKLNLDCFMKAFKQRRTYSTETRTLKLDFKLNGYCMGSIVVIEKDEKIKIEIMAEDTKVPIKKIQVISNNSKIVEEKVFDDAVDIAKLSVTLSPEIDNQWFVVRIIHENNKWGISSPIFVTNNV